MTPDAHSYLLRMVSELRAELTKARGQRNYQRKRAEYWKRVALRERRQPTQRVAAAFLHPRCRCHSIGRTNTT